jgi:hypothetical protein
VRFLLAMAVFMIYLGLDDALLIHEDVFPNRLNGPQPVVLAVLAVVALEDSFKTFGIGLLAYWCFDWSRRALAEALRKPERGLAETAGQRL